MAWHKVSPSMPFSGVSLLLDHRERELAMVGAVRVVTELAQALHQEGARDRRAVDDQHRAAATARRRDRHIGRTG
jgi:hypothetical protein